MPGRRSVSQAWVELRAEDPAAVSALAVARRRLVAGRQLAGLRRLRVIELAGRLPERSAQEDLLHRSTQFYNPYKERCVLRTRAGDRAPVEADEQVVLVAERGDERRAAAERWWLHQTGQAIEVREAVAWVMRFAPGSPAATLAAELTTLRDRRHGLLCNPHAQQARQAGARVPLPWMSRKPSSTGGGESS